MLIVRAKRHFSTSKVRAKRHPITTRKTSRRLQVERATRSVDNWNSPESPEIHAQIRKRLRLASRPGLLRAYPGDSLGMRKKGNCNDEIHEDDVAQRSGFATIRRQVLRLKPQVELAVDVLVRLVWRLIVGLLDLTRLDPDQLVEAGLTRAAGS